jgi:hypothetical protein
MSRWIQRVMAKEKKNLTMTSYSGYKPTSQKVQRKDVPSTINRLKSGATRTESYPKKKK